VLYNADENEVLTEAMWQAALTQGKTVYYPRITTDKSELEFVRRYPQDRLIPGTFGILIPPGDDMLAGLQGGDIVLTPGVGFDEKGHRLGRGRGYYDRALRGVLAGALRVALAYELQIVPEIPAGPGDERVHWIVTEGRLIACVENYE
jgi:5-formyltetrahydrofolate cyclo-ligase